MWLGWLPLTLTAWAGFYNLTLLGGDFWQEMLLGLWTGAWQPRVQIIWLVCTKHSYCHLLWIFWPKVVAWLTSQSTTQSLSHNTVSIWAIFLIAAMEQYLSIDAWATVLLLCTPRTSSYCYKCLVFDASSSTDWLSWWVAIFIGYRKLIAKVLMVTYIHRILVIDGYCTL